ncbi:augurin isoform X2 [Tamandua tetradactyla]|uniref:augurin isoform X2 n=1 Tax=Tamandua tetradactyla TaxID=48850 RepID=UPI004053C3CF
MAVRKECGLRPENSDAGGTSGNKLKLMLQKREASAPTKTEVDVDESKAKEFLQSLKRAKRQLWETGLHSWGWYQPFLYMDSDEAKFEDDDTYWLNSDRNGHEYYKDYYRHHDD